MKGEFKGDEQKTKHRTEKKSGYERETSAEADGNV